MEWYYALIRFSGIPKKVLIIRWLCACRYENVKCFSFFPLLKIKMYGCGDRVGDSHFRRRDENIYLFFLKNSCISARHSSSSTPLTTSAFGCKALGAILR